MKKHKINIHTISMLSLVAIIVISMLSVRNIDLTGISLSTLLVFALSIGWIFYDFMVAKGKVIFLRKSYHSMDTTVLIIICYEALLMIGKILNTSELTVFDFNLNIMILSFAFIYYLISRGMDFKIEYYDVILYIGLVVMGFMLFGYLCDDNMSGFMNLILQDTTATASYLLPLAVISIYMYCNCRDRIKMLFYLLTSVVSFFVLLINHNIVSLWMMIGVFLTIPIILIPTGELIKRDMQSMFIFVFMMSNMSLITNYTNLLPQKTSYNLETSVYLELLFAIGGIVFFHYWERIPQNIDLHRIVMKKMYKEYCNILMVTAIIFIFIVIGGENWGQLPDGIGYSAFKSFALPLTEEIKNSKNSFYIILDKQGIVGCGLIILFLIQIIGKMRNNSSINKPVTGANILITTIFMVQLLFWTPCISILPVYFIIMMFATFGKETEIRVTSIKIRRDLERNIINE